MTNTTTTTTTTTPRFALFTFLELTELAAAVGERRSKHLAKWCELYDATADDNKTAEYHKRMNGMCEKLAKEIIAEMEAQAYASDDEAELDEGAEEAAEAMGGTTDEDLVAVVEDYRERQEAELREAHTHEPLSGTTIKQCPLGVPATYSGPDAHGRTPRWFSFGSSHKHLFTIGSGGTRVELDIGGINDLIEVWAQTDADAREWMFDNFGEAWCMMYSHDKEPQHGMVRLQVSLPGLPMFMREQAD